MIVLDTSALVAILLGEPEAADYERAIEDADRTMMSAVSRLEAGIVLRARVGTAGLDTLMDLIRDAAIEVAPFDEAQAAMAIEAFGRYGKGIDPNARLNFGDCASYALAMSLAVPLLFKGNDFSATDATPAI